MVSKLVIICLLKVDSAQKTKPKSETLSLKGKTKAEQGFTKSLNYVLLEPSLIAHPQS